MGTFDKFISILPSIFLRKPALRILDLLSTIQTLHKFPPPYDLNSSRAVHNCRICLKDNITNPLIYNPYKFEIDPMVECEIHGKMKWSKNNSAL
jgi:hypothetical protein